MKEYVVKIVWKHRSRFLLYSAGVACFLSCSPVRYLAAQAPAHGKTEGAAIFTNTCAGCHGADGHGGEHAPNIATSSAVRQLSDARLLQIVTKGIPGTGMPAFGALGQETVTSIVGYLRELQGAGNAVALPGDPSRGETLFFGKAECSACHTVGGRGGFLSNDLTLFGAGQKPDAVRGILAEPKDTLPKNSGWTRVVTKDGQSVQGILRSEDNFDLSLQSADGRFHSVSQSEIQQRTSGVHAGTDAVHAPTLSYSEIDDLVSYLIQSGNLHVAQEQNVKQAKE